MQDGQKAVLIIPYVSLVCFPRLKPNFIAHRSSKMSYCIFEIHQLWQSGFSRVYSNCCCSCSFEAEIIKIGQSSHKMYRNKILNFQDSSTIRNTHTKNVWKLIVCTSYLSLSLSLYIYIYIYIYTCVCVCVCVCVSKLCHFLLYMKDRQIMVSVFCVRLSYLERFLFLFSCLWCGNRIYSPF